MRAGRKVPIYWGATGLAAKGPWRKEEQGGGKRGRSGGDTGRDWRQAGKCDYWRGGFGFQ